MPQPSKGHTSSQQSNQIPIVTFASIVPVTDVVGELNCANEIGENAAVDNEVSRPSVALQRTLEREQSVSLSDLLNEVTAQLATSLQSVLNVRSDKTESNGVSVTKMGIQCLQPQQMCPVDELISERLSQLEEIQRKELEAALAGSNQNEAITDAESMNNHLLNCDENNGHDEAIMDINKAINPEDALPTKAMNVDTLNFNLEHRHSQSNGSLNEMTDEVSSTTGQTRKTKTVPIKEESALDRDSSKPFTDMFSRNPMVKLTQLDLLSSPMGGAGTGSQQNEETKPEFKMTASIKLTKIDEEAMEKALRGKKMTEVTYSKTHREQTGLFDYLSSQFIPTSSKRFSTIKNQDKKGQKRPREEGGSDDDKELFGSVDEGDASNHGKSGTAASKVVEPAWKKRKYNRVYSLQDRQMSKKEIKDSSEFKRCAQLLDSLLESVDEAFLPKSTKQHKKKKKKTESTTSSDEEAESDDDSVPLVEFSEDRDSNRLSCPPELQVKRAMLSELATECSKLKEVEIMNVIPVEKLVKLFSVLEQNIRDGSKLALSSKSKPAVNGAIDRTNDCWREMVLERVWRATEASLLALTILTAPNMPKRVYIEELFETMIKFLHYQFANTIFPEFDPLYRTTVKEDGKEKGEKADASLKAKRAKAVAVKEKSLLSLYQRFGELVTLLSDLLAVQVMTDSVLLQLSSLAISVFFVENISELQLATLRLITSVFARYPRHRQLIFQELFSSLSRLPSSKRSLRPFRLTEDEHIQMVTALVLQLIQSVIHLPSQSELAQSVDQAATAAIAGERQSSHNQSANATQKSEGLDIDVTLNNCSMEANKTTQTLLNVFLTKCTTKSDEDFRPLFENFVQDLLTTVNKPEWPASEFALSLLGRLLNMHFTAKGSDTALRVTCLDYLGVIAARLRKDAATSKCSRSDIETVLKELKNENKPLVNFEDDDEGEDWSRSKESFTQQLQRVMLDYLQDLSDTEPSLLYAKGYYIAQWYRDMRLEIERCTKLLNNSNATDSEASQSAVGKLSPPQLMQKVKEAEQQKQFLLSLIHAKPGSGVASLRNAHLNLSYESACLIASYLASERPFMKSFDVYLRQIIAVLAEPSVAIRTKAVKCLTAVVEADPSLLSRVELQHAVNSMFIDSSSNVREAAVDLLSRFVLLQDDLPEKYFDMIANRILDTGISVRKRVVRILRDICIEKPDFPRNTEICCKLIRRINDEDSIRKLVLEVFEKLWFTPVVPVNVAIKSSHSPNSGSNKVIQLKINQIVETLRHATDTGFEGFQNLLSILVKDDKEGSISSASNSNFRALTEIVDGIMEYMVNLEESEEAISNDQGGRSRVHSSKLMSCLSVLYHIAKIKPTLLANHANELQPYLATKVSNEFDSMVLYYTAAIFEITVPLISNPSENLLTSLQEELMKVVMNGGQNALSNCVSCLTTVVMKVTKNYETLNDCIDKFFTTLASVRACQELTSKQGSSVTGESDYIGKAKGSLSRALYALGLLAQKYDPFQHSQVGLSMHLYQHLTSPSTNSSSDERVNQGQHTSPTPANPASNHEANAKQKQRKFGELVADHMLYYARCHSPDVVAKALTGLGFICSAHPELLLWEKVKSLYFDVLETGATLIGSNIGQSLTPKAGSGGSAGLRQLVLHNMEQYLIAEDERLQQADEEFKKAKVAAESGAGGATMADTLKEMGDLNSGMASSIIQIYLNCIFANFFATQPSIRAQALKVVSLVLKQGLVQPVNCVPYLIALSSDTDASNRNRAHEQLVDIDTKYPGFVHQKASQGLSLAFSLHRSLLPAYELIRGYRIEYEGQAPNQMCHVEACCSALYTLLRTQRNNRRALVKPLLAMFDSADHVSLRELLFFADNLSSFKYLMQDEVFFIVHVIDIQLSISGANILSEFKNVFYPERRLLATLVEQKESAMENMQLLLPNNSMQISNSFQYQSQSANDQQNALQTGNYYGNSFMYTQQTHSNEIYNQTQGQNLHNMYHQQGDFGNMNPQQQMYMQHPIQQHGMMDNVQGYYMGANGMMYGQTQSAMSPAHASVELNALQSLASNPQMGQYVQGNPISNSSHVGNTMYPMQYLHQQNMPNVNAMAIDAAPSPNVNPQQGQLSSPSHVLAGQQSYVNQGQKSSDLAKSADSRVQVQPLPDEDDFEDEHSLLEKYPEEDAALTELLKQSHACILLCLIKQHLKTVYSVSDSKFQHYSPNEAAKVFEKAVSRKSGVKFEPTVVINYIQFGGYTSPVVDPQQRLAVVRHYLEFKDLIMQLDTCAEDENGEPIGRTLGHPSQNKFSSSATVTANNSGQGNSLNNNNDEDQHLPNDQQILKNASFMERMQKKSKKGKSTKKTPVKKRGRKSRVVIHSDSEEDSPDADDSDPDFS